jgi:hypothetical protein
MSNNGSQFLPRFSPVHHPQSSPSERIMKELSKFCCIYCHQNHRSWADLLPHIEQWLNKTVASSRGYAPVELIFSAQKPDIFVKFLPELGDSPEKEEMAAKVLKPYTKMKEKAL